MTNDRTYSPKAIELLDAAERHMKKGGFDAFSFRELAKETGIKSSSVHYYFPQKADIGAAVVSRYRDGVLGELGDVGQLAQEGPSAVIGQLISVYRNALEQSEAVCLCAMLGAEIAILPEPVAVEVSRFYDAIYNWAKTGLNLAGYKDSDLKASGLISSLVGAMTLSIATKSTEHFDHTAKGLMAQFA